MLKPPIPHNEHARLETLRGLRLLDTPPEERFDRVTRLAQRLFGVPIALVSLVDEGRQWFKSRQGLAATETPREVSFCGHAILGDKIMVVEDAEQDERFCDNPLVCDSPNVRFYAGYPIQAPDGSKLGTLCVIDTKPKKLKREDLQLLRELGRMIEEEVIAVDLSTTDQLTGISNRRGFDVMATYALGVCDRLESSATLLHFKLLNLEEIGAASGGAEVDRTLVELSHIMLASFRHSDVVGRTSADGFCSLLLGADEVGTERAMHRMQESISQHNRAQTNIELAVAEAIVMYRSEKHSCVENLIREAEERATASAQAQPPIGTKTA